MPNNALSSRLSRSPRLSALLSQLLGALLAALFAFLIPEMRLTPWMLVGIQGAGAAIASYHLGAPSWWQLIHLVFAPLVLIGSGLSISPWFWFGGFVCLYLVFGRTDRTQVPLFLTNRTTGNALLNLLPPEPCFVLDVGCGDGRLVRQLARARPDSEFVGIEHAWLTWLWARLLSGHLSNVHIRQGDFWEQPLTPFDLVYAFLSPTPMTKLWEKARNEMRPDTRLISNSFAISHIEPETLIEVTDKRATQLYCYRISDPDQ